MRPKKIFTEAEKEEMRRIIAEMQSDPGLLTTAPPELSADALLTHLSELGDGITDRMMQANLPQPEISVMFVEGVARVTGRFFGLRLPEAKQAQLRLLFGECATAWLAGRPPEVQLYLAQKVAIDTLFTDHHREAWVPPIAPHPWKEILFGKVARNKRAMQGPEGEGGDITFRRAASRVKLLLDQLELLPHGDVFPTIREMDVALVRAEVARWQRAIEALSPAPDTEETEIDGEEEPITDEEFAVGGTPEEEGAAGVCIVCHGTGLRYPESLEDTDPCLSCNGTGKSVGGLEVNDEPGVS